MKRLKEVLSISLIRKQLSYFLPAFIFLLMVPDAPAFYLPDTGQTTSYTATWGEDSDYTINPPSYTDNGDGTVTDNVTGLMWQQQDDNNQYNWYEATGTYDAIYNAGSTDVCGSLTLADYSDWRMPTIKELTRIVHRDQFNPSINSAYFPGTNSSFYWTSNRSAAYSSYAWNVEFADGFENANSSNNNKSDSHYVRCVRGGEGSSGRSLTDNNNGTVTDNDTGLIWQQGESSPTTYWEPALNYCEGLSLAGANDWRVPNINELQSLVDDGRFAPAIDTNYFPGVSSNFDYWSSTTLASDSSYVWAVDSYHGNFFGISAGVVYVRCVRTGVLCIDDDGDGYTTCAGDCDDTDSAINPGATEVCDDTLDNDCDGLTDLVDSDCGVILPLVTNYYNDILDRAPEADGAEWWTAEIERIVFLGIDVKEGFIAVSMFFFNSAEYLLQNKTDDEYVTDLYEAFLDRTPAQSEVDYWTGKLAQGLSRNVVLNYFAYSEEFRLYMEGIFGVGSTRPENNLVNDFYRGFLNRLPDTGGFNSWLSLMQTAQCTGAQEVIDLSDQIALGFIQGAEYALRNRDNQEYVEDLYNGILRRGAEAVEFNYWLGYLDGGTYTREGVLEFFTTSAEFQIRVQAVIDAGCI